MNDWPGQKGSQGHSLKHTLGVGAAGNGSSPYNKDSQPSKTPFGDYNGLLGMPGLVLQGVIVLSNKHTFKIPSSLAACTDCLFWQHIFPSSPQKHTPVLKKRENTSSAKNSWPDILLEHTLEIDSGSSNSKHFFNKERLRRKVVKVKEGLRG